ncbi:MAG: DNA repair protein RecN [Thermodesulfobacteriota bacterium]|nr:DNA repair protein RecN [Thermodesulfobacteriota bacterium]
MLEELSIKKFAIINDIRISFSRGLSVLTGETGAGKSIIVEAVNLLLGSRASADLVRTGEESAELEALFEIDLNSSAASLMEEQGLDPLEGLMIRRIISASGKHRVFINSRQSTMQFLKLVTENLAGISSQHAHQGLLKEENHLDILDRFAGTYPLRNQVKEIFNELVPLKKKLLDLKAGVDKTNEENLFLIFQIKEIEDARILPNEDKELESEKNRLKNGAEIFEAVNRACEEIYSKENSIIEKLGIIKADFEKYETIDPLLVKNGEKISQTLFELEDLAEELRSYAAAIELDPQALEGTEARLDLIQKLKRKYGPTLEDLFFKHEELKKKLASTENIEQKIEELEQRSELLLRDLSEKSLSLSKKRKKAGKELGSLVENELKELEMAQTRFTVSIVCEKADAEKGYFCKNEVENPGAGKGDIKGDITTSDGIKIRKTGIDRVAFLMAPNPGETPKALSRIASGGELSRVVLALKAVLSETESLGTLVFDEVDAGIGGKTSEKVGRKLKKLSSKYQVICITHLAQIAKYGTSHFEISKSVLNERTSTSITPLTDQDKRVKEIARMIAGEEITPATLAHASEMLGGRS